MARSRKRKAAKVVVIAAKAKRASVSRHVAPSGKLIRPRLYKLGGKIRKSRRSGLGTGVITINPRRRRSAGRKLGFLTIRKNRARRHNPRFVRRHRRHSYRRNPAMNIKASFKNLMSKSWLMEIAVTGAGIVAGFGLTNFIRSQMNAQTSLSQYSKYSGAMNLVVGSFLAVSMKKAALKKIGVMVAATGLYDLISMNTNFLPKVNIDLTQIGKFGSSYPVPVLPRSPVAALSASMPAPAAAGYAGSYLAPDMRTQGFGSMVNPYEEISW